MYVLYILPEVGWIRASLKESPSLDWQRWVETQLRVDVSHEVLL